jgi:hypothetical protein
MLERAVAKEQAVLHRQGLSVINEKPLGRQEEMLESIRSIRPILLAKVIDACRPRDASVFCKQVLTPPLS